MNYRDHVLKSCGDGVQACLQAVAFAAGLLEAKAMAIRKAEVRVADLGGNATVAALTIG